MPRPSSVLRSVPMLAIAFAGCAKNGKLPYQEVVSIPVPTANHEERTTLPSDVVAVLDDPNRPLDLKVTVGAVERTVAYEHVREETWTRRPWAWKAEPKEHAQLAGYMALGGATLILAGVIGEGDSDAKATAAGVGALALLGSPVPLVVLGVRKLQTHDSLESVVERDRIGGVSDSFHPRKLYSGTLDLDIASASPPGTTGVLAVKDGAFNPSLATLTYIEPAYRVRATSHDGVEIRWDLSDVGPQELYLAHREYLVASPGANPAFTVSYGAWQRAAAERRKEEFNRALTNAVVSCGNSFAAAWACGEVLGERESTFGQVLQDNLCDFVAARVTGQDFGYSDAFETSVTSLVESRFPDYRKYLVKGGAFIVCVGGRMNE